MIDAVLADVDTNLQKVNINALSNIDLEIAHKAVWKDATKHVPEAKDMNVPGYIPYKEYEYASQHLCRSCRNLVKNYELTISHTTYGFLVEVKKVLSYIRNEVLIIRNIATHTLGDRYRDESEGNIATHMLDWIKNAMYYVNQVATEMTTQPISIPEEEVDGLTEIDAARFESFFAVKVNSYTSEIQAVSNLIKRDSVDIAGNFYSNYLVPAMKFKSAVIEPLLFNFSTTEMSRQSKFLAGEMMIADNSVTGNLGSIATDYIERRIQFSSRMEAFLQLMRMKRRYVNFMVQLESIGIQRQRVHLPQVDDPNYEKYVDIFSSIDVDSEKRSNLRSPHNQLDDLDEDAHPQYIRKDGGTITGSIEMAKRSKNSWNRDS